MIEKLNDQVDGIVEFIPARKNMLSVTPAQKAELNRRLALYLSNPENVVSWESVKSRVVANLGL